MNTVALRTYEQLKTIAKKCIKKKRPFTMEIQNETMTINAGKWGSGSNRAKNYTVDDINFIKAVKTYIVKNNLYEPYLNYRIPGNGKVKYFSYNPKLKAGDTYTGILNIDLTGAYWETAYQLKLIDENLYQRGLKVDKFVRLAAIGSLAKKKYIYEFDGKKQFLKEVVHQELTEKLWDVICHHVGVVLQDAAKAAGKDFIFFWVDGINIKSEAAQKVKQCFKKHGYRFTIDTNIKEIQVTEKKIYVHLKKPELFTVDGETKEKTFKPFPFRGRSK